MIRKLRSLITTAALTASAICASAQVTVTFTGTANSSVQGYTANNSYTFTFTLNPNWTFDSPHSYGNYMQWYDEDAVTDDALFTGIAGTGLLGTFNRVTAPSWATYYYIDADINSDTGNFFAGDDNSSNIGITTLAGTATYLNVNYDTAFLTASTGEITPEDYFAGFAGSHAVAGQITLINPSTWSTFLSFSVTSVTINGAAIPEPSTYAAILGAGALGLVAWRRRQKRAA